MPDINRRQFIAGSAGIAFFLSLPLTGCSKSGAPANRGSDFSAWVKIFPDNRITVVSPAAEMGQGSMTSIPMIFAEELDADWAQVDIEFSPADDEIFKNPTPWAWGVMMTLGSSAVSGYFDTVRLLGAQARKVLLGVAAEYWDVPVAELTTEPSTVLHKASGRRLNYGEIAELIEEEVELPEVGPEDLKSPEQFRIIGQDIERYDIPPKVTGDSIYSIDVELPDMLYASIVRAPQRGSKPLGISNESEIGTLPGILRLVELPDAVAIVATGYQAALDAEKQLTVEWQAVDKLANYNEQSGLDNHQQAVMDSQLGGLAWQQKGDVNSALRQSHKLFEAEFQTEYLYHAQMEPLNAVAQVTEDGKHAEVWAGTQVPTYCTRSIAAALEIPVSQVKLHRTMLGGGFGRRAAMDQDYVVDAVLLSRIMGKPVKSIWSREQDVRAARLKPITVQHLKAGFDNQGRLVAWHHRVASDEAHKQADPYRYKQNKNWPVISGVGLETQYDIENILAEVIDRDTGVRIAPLRGIGGSLNKFASESFIDEIALKQGLDPLQFRLQLLEGNELAQGVLRAVSEMSGWPARDLNEGFGLAFGESGESWFGVIAKVDVNHSDYSIHVQKVWVAIDVGLAVHPDNIKAQVESGVIYAISNTLKERITFRNGAVEQSNFHDYPILRIDEIPDIETRIISRTDSKPTGVGDTTPVLIPAAIANGFAAATGKRIRHLPMTSDVVANLLQS